jgi:short-subunit dehydrogenase
MARRKVPIAPTTGRFPVGTVVIGKEVVMRTLEGKRVLITGGASGIGRAIADRCAGRGARLVLVDLNEAALSATADQLRATGATVDTFTADLSDVGQIALLSDRVHAAGGAIDVLVNNAGVVFGGGFLDVPVEKHLLTYQINTIGLVAMTHAFLPDLIASPDGHLVNTASASGLIGLPYGATYASSKWSVIGFSESIALELEELGHRHVHVTVLCPSYVSTGLFDGAKAPRFTRLLTADRVADRTVRAMLANRFAVRMPWLVSLTPPLKGLLPLRLFNRVARLLGVSTSMSHWKGRTGTGS